MWKWRECRVSGVKMALVSFLFLSPFFRTRGKQRAHTHVICDKFVNRTIRHRFSTTFRQHTWSTTKSKETEERIYHENGINCLCCCAMILRQSQGMAYCAHRPIAKAYLSRCVQERTCAQPNISLYHGQQIPSGMSSIPNIWIWKILSSRYSFDTLLPWMTTTTSTIMMMAHYTRII